MIGKHPNVVELLGVLTDADNDKGQLSCSDGDGDGDELPMLAMEYVERGSLDQVLLNAWSHPDAPYASPDTRLHFARDVAAGMANIHSGGVLHNDIAARNVLITQDYTVCACALLRVCTVASVHCCECALSFDWCHDGCMCRRRCVTLG